MIIIDSFWITLINSMLERAKEEEELLPLGLDEEVNQQQPKQREKETSHHYQEYHNKTASFRTLISHDYLSRTTDQFYRQGIYYRPHKPFRNHFELQFREGSVNREVMIFIAKWGYFSIKIKVLNTDRPLKQLHKGESDSGTFGFIYQGFFGNKDVVVKCISIRLPSHRRKLFREYFLAKIGSALEIGPKMQPIFGFDLLITPNCGHFAMQPCDHLNPGKLNLKDMFWNLSLMHQYGIVHQDIKPENIMFSRELNKAVFIDFGLSAIVAEQVGHLSLTEFVGNVNYCSRQMMKCFLEDKKMEVDLFYNDLHALEGSLKAIETNTSLRDHSSEIDYFEEVQKPSFDYFSVVKAKFFLYQGQIDQLLKFEALLTQTTKQSHREEILNFLLELHPTRWHLQLFKRYSSFRESETVDFKKMKVLSEMSEYTLAPFQILVDHQKLSMYTQHCQQLEGIQDESEGDKEKGKLKAVRELVMSSSLIKEIPFEDYVLSYLLFMSYINNRCRVDASTREAAAKLYQQLFLNLSEKLQGRRLIQKTILDILERAFNKSLFAGDIYKLTIFTFRVHDFLVILDVGSAEDYFQHASHLLEKMPSFLHYTFLNRVSLSSLLNIFRVTKKGSISRVSFRKSIYGWIQQKMMKVNQLKSTFSPADLIRKQETLESDKFIEEFGLQTIDFFREQSKYRMDKNMRTLMFEVLSKIICKGGRWPYFALLLFQQGISQWQTYNLCKTISNCIKDSIGDEEMMGEFSFDFQLWTRKELSTSNITTIIEGAEDYLQQVNLEDLFYFNRVMFSIFDTIRLASTFQKNTAHFGRKHFKFMERIFESNLQYLQGSIVFENNAMEHIHIEQHLVMKLFSLSQSLVPARESSIMEVLASILKESSKCEQCDRKVNLLIRISNIQKLLLGFCSSEEPIPQSLVFQAIPQLQGSITQEKDETQTDILQKGLYLGALVCCLDAQLEQNYHGLMNYYQFATREKRISCYFSNYIYNNFPLLSTIKLLYQNSPSQCAWFVVQLAAVPQSTWRIVDLETLKQYSLMFFKELSESELQTFFHLINLHQTQSSGIVVIYASLFHFCRSILLERKLCSAIQKKISLVHFRFQRHVSFLLLQKISKELRKKGSERTERENRKWRFCNNQFVKTIMILEQTVISPRKKSRKKMKDLLLQKVQKIEQGNPKFYFAQFVWKKK